MMTGKSHLHMDSQLTEYGSVYEMMKNYRETGTKAERGGNKA